MHCFNIDCTNINFTKFSLTRISEMFTSLLELQYQACDPSEAEAWLPWQSPSWLQYEENDNLSAKKKKKRKEMKK